jgi:hypothetical protein
VVKLENEFEQLKAGLKNTSRKDWRAVVGTYEVSSTFDSVMHEMRRLRRKDYEEAAQKNAGS